MVNRDETPSARRAKRTQRSALQAGGRAGGRAPPAKPHRPAWHMMADAFPSCSAPRLPTASLSGGCEYSDYP